MSEDGQRAARAAPGLQQEQLPPPPRLVQYGVAPARQPASREGGGGGVAVAYLAREDQRMETERRQQLAHSIQLLQQKAARQQQEARLGVSRPVGVQLSSSGVTPGQGAAVPGAARLTAYRPPSATGYARHAGAAAAIGGETANPVQTHTNPGQPPPVTVANAAAASVGRPMKSRSQPSSIRPGQMANAAPTALEDGQVKAADRSPTVAAAVSGIVQSKPPAPSAVQMRNGANSVPVDSQAEVLTQPLSPASGRSPPAKRTSRSMSKETEPAAKRARSDAGIACTVPTAAAGDASNPAAGTAPAAAALACAEATSTTVIASVPVVSAAAPVKAADASPSLATTAVPAHKVTGSVTARTAHPSAVLAAVKIPAAITVTIVADDTAADGTPAAAVPAAGTSIPAAAAVPAAGTSTPAAATAAAPTSATPAVAVAAATANATANASPTAASVAAAATAPTAASVAAAAPTNTAPSAAPIAAAAAATSAATTAATATTATTATATATASPTHKGKKSWLSRLANTDEPSADSPASSDSGGDGGDGGEKTANHGPTPASDETDGSQAEEMEVSSPAKTDNDTQAETDDSPVEKMDTASPGETEGSPTTEEVKPTSEEPSPETEEQDVQDGSSSGDGESAANGAEESNGVLAPRAAAAATKAAAAAKKSPGRPKKKSGASPAVSGPKRPSVMALKKSGESFAQTNFCCQIATKLPRCRECRAVPMQRHNKPTGIYCRFTAFRKVRYTRNGQLTVTGFCDPYSDAGGESDRLWRANPDGPPTMDPEIAKFLLAHVGNQFCDLVTDEDVARGCHMSEEKTVAWKRVVQGCREMCDVCETTLFNVHWVCSRCGFAVCVDCYRSRRDGTAKDWGEPLAERDQYRWLLCGIKPHQQDKLVLTQIVAGDALETLNRQVHEARQMAGLPLSCECEVAKRLQKESGEAAGKAAAAGDGVKTEPGLGAPGVKTEGGVGGGGGGTQKPPGATLSFLADVALSKITSDDSDSDDSDDSDAGGGSLALRKLLVPGTQAETKPKPVKKERPDRPKRSGWSMGDSLDEVLDKVSARCSAAAPVSHTASGPAALTHFVRRCAKRGFRERLPIRIMTLGESTRLYPAVRHSWLCDGKLLRLHESDAPDSIRLFRDQWKRGQPVVCSGIGGGLDRSIWSVDAFIRDFGDVRNDLINCRTGNIVPNQPMRRFWEGFESVTRRLRDDKGQPMILKLKDWPPGEDFADMMPRRFADLMSVLPMTEYTRRDGRLNLASCLPDIFVRPDLGPKMYIAYGCALHPSKASTNLHLDVSDAVNIMVHVGIPPDGDADNAEALRAIDEAGCDQLTKRRVRDEMPGALWHIYHAADADKIRDLLNKMAIERGDQLEPHHDPIHDQSWYLDGPLRRRLYEEYRVEGYPIVQCAGDAVFIPAGAPHQVRNLHSCIKVAEDFVSPENIGHCFDLTQEFRSLSDTHTNHEDKLQIKNIIYHAMKDAVSCLLGAARPASAADAEAEAAGDNKNGGEGGKAAAATAEGGDSPAAGTVKVKTEPGV